MTTKISDFMRTAFNVQTTSKLPTGTSLYLQLPNAKHDLVKQHFGSSFAEERGYKYSSGQHVFAVGGLLVTLYMSFGVWRFGSDDHVRDNPAVQRTIETMAAVLSGDTPS